MKSKLLYIILLITVFSSCLESPEMTNGIVNGKEKPTVITDSTSVFFNKDGNLLFKGIVISEGKSKIKVRGFYWSTTSENPNSGDNSKTETDVDVNDDIFTFELKDIKGETTYYWRAFAENNAGFDLSEIVCSSRTPKLVPTVVTDSIAPFFTNGNLLFQGKIIDEGRGKIIERGFYWSTTSDNPNSSDNKKNATYVDGNIFTYELTEISAGTTYYWRAWAQNSDGIDSSEIVYNYTPVFEPIVETISIVSTEDGVLSFKGNILDKGIDDIIERGFLWSFNPDDLLNGNKISAITNSESNYTSELRNASGDKTYYCRAYAKNASSHFGYGDIKSYETPNIWERKEIINTQERGIGATFVLNNKIYITCGEVQSGRQPTKQTWEYNILSNRWQNLGDYPGDFRVYPVVFTIGNFAYIGTGMRSSGGEIIANKDFYRINSSSNEWDRTAIETPSEMEARYLALAFGFKGKGYVVGGYFANRTVSDDVWRYNSENDSWEEKNPFPEKIYEGISICNNNRVFSGFGKYANGDPIRTLWEYYDATDEWKYFTEIPDDVEVGGTINSGVIVGNTIYIIDDKNVIWACNTESETKQWELKAKLPSVFTGGDSQYLLTNGISNSIYVGLGYSIYLYEYKPLWDN